MEDFPQTNNSQFFPDDSIKTKSFFRTILFKVLCGIILMVLGYFLFLSPPSGFVSGSIINIKEGASLRSVSLQLKREHFIRSTIAFEAFVILYGGEKHIIPTDYLLDGKLPVFEIARRLSHGEHHLAPVKVTIPEGYNNEEIAESFSSKLKNFDKSKFLEAAKSKEGYLFPDTYFFSTTSSEEEVLKSMTDNFEKKVSPIRSKIASVGRTEKEIIIMASIIEREAKGDGDRGFISGILWKRISIGMPLQADAAPETYRSKGLPQAPIGNPGLEAINAAIYPKNPSFFIIFTINKGTYITPEVLMSINLTK